MDLTYGSKIVLRRSSGQFAAIDPSGDFNGESMDAAPFLVINAKFPRDRHTHT
jgi:hypothetical protein